MSTTNILYQPYGFTYPTNSKTSATTHKIYWYALYLGGWLVCCSIPKIQILKFSQTHPKFKMNFKFHFKMFVCELISTNKLQWSIFSPKSSSKYSTNISPVIPSNCFQKYCPDISPMIPFKFFPEILPRYSTDISQVFPF